MEWTLNLAVFAEALSQRSSSVRTQIVNDMNPFAVQKHRHGGAVRKLDAQAFILAK